MGYAGGATPDPTYTDLGDHTETLEVDYDPDVISYDDLLGVFFAEHDPCRPAFKRQYRSVAFVRTEEERQAVEACMAGLEERRGCIHTAVEPFTRFYLAEEYHQRYSWKQFATQWGYRSTAPAPDNRSPEFARWLERG